MAFQITKMQRVNAAVVKDAPSLFTYASGDDVKADVVTAAGTYFPSFTNFNQLINIKTGDFLMISGNAGTFAGTFRVKFDSNGEMSLLEIVSKTVPA